LLRSLARQRDPGLGGLERAFDSAAHLLREWVSDNPGSDLDFSPSCTLLVAFVTPEQAEIAWLGPERALLVRGRDAVAVTQPHTLRELYREQGVVVPEGTEIPPVVVRVLGPGGAQGGAAGRAWWALEPGDRLALLSKDLGEIAPEEVARRASEGALGEALVRVKEAVVPRFPRAVAAVLAEV
jgi:hypothetical protein